MISARLVMPFLALSRADWRRSRMPAAGDLGDLQGVAAGEDDLLDVFAHRHHLIDAGATLVAFVAARTADCLERVLVLPWE